MATSNKQADTEKIPLVGLIVIAVFLLAMVGSLIWMAQPDVLGYNHSPFVPNPTSVVAP
jgi:hypothetical protein